MSAPDFIPYGRQHIDDADIQAVVDTLRSDFITQGPKVPAFEAAIAKHCHSDHAIAFNSATSALHGACYALGLGAGDQLWTSPNTFVASANCGRYCGADIDFVDIDPDTYNISVSALSRKLAAHRASGRPLPKILVVVHFAGQPCDMAAIAELARQYNFHVIEDASHAIGARYQGEPVGNGRYSDITVFSFHPVKIITSAEGGMALTLNQALAEQMTLFRSHCITRDSDMMQYASDGPWYYEQLGLGYNYRMTELQAALGLSQFSKLTDFIHRRHHLAARYSELLAKQPVTLPHQAKQGHSALHLYPVLVPESDGAQLRLSVFNSMREQNIGVNVHYIPVYRQPYYQRMGFTPEQFPVSEKYYARTLSLPLYPDLTEHQQDRVVECLTEALAAQGY